ncbi:MAG: hypothetical protein ABS951_11350 [Solibacillus sp.]
MFINYLQQKYEQQLSEIEQFYPINWYMEINNHQIWAPSTTLAFTHLGKRQLSVCFLLHHIEKEINTKHSITNPLLLKNVSECFVEFLFLHELKHMQQFCNGLTLKQYKKLGSYKTNPHEEQATQFALETMKLAHPEKFELLQFILNKGKINHLNESKWQQHFIDCK